MNFGFRISDCEIPTTLRCRGNRCHSSGLFRNPNSAIRNWLFPIRNRAGFTLLEIMVVVTIIAIMMAITFPSMRKMNEKNKLRGDARQITSLMKYARTEAVFGERTTEIFLDLDKRQYWLDLREPKPEKETYSKPKQPKVRNVELKHDLDNDIWFEETSAYDENIIEGKSKVIAIDFHPDGSASPTLLTLTNKAGAKMTIEVLKATGQVEITPGSIADKQAQAEQQQQVTVPPAPGANGG